MHLVQSILQKYHQHDMQKYSLAMQRALLTEGHSRCTDCITFNAPYAVCTAADMCMYTVLSARAQHRQHVYVIAQQVWRDSIDRK
jgi:hypothetical protein